jgi:hypothetical protein
MYISEILDLLEKENLLMAYTLGRKIIKNKLNWWF